MAEKQFGGNREGGYVFISHSHLDIDKVRILRNRMEEEGFEPLCFYLKCLTEEDEITGLIQREIDAREWFVYVDSKNARNSDWVAKVPFSQASTEAAVDAMLEHDQLHEAVHGED